MAFEILANALETIWSRRFIRPVSPLMNVLIILALTLNLTGLVTAWPTAEFAPCRCSVGGLFSICYHLF